MGLTNGVIDALLRVDQQTGAPVGTLAVLAQTRLNVDAALKVRRIVRTLAGPHADFVAVRDALVAEYGEDGAINPASPRWSEFAAPYAELLSAEVEVECEPLTAADLWHRVDLTREPIELSAAELDALGPLLAD
jgi:hypothetical protein